MQFGIYKNRTYRVIWIGNTKTTPSKYLARLEFMDRTKQFWADGHAVELNPAAQMLRDTATPRPRPTTVQTFEVRNANTPTPTVREIRPETPINILDMVVANTERPTPRVATIPAPLPQPAPIVQPRPIVAAPAPTAPDTSAIRNFLLNALTQNKTHNTKR